MEAELLRSLLGQLEAVLDGAEGGLEGEAVRRRLLPEAYPEDPAAEAEFRTLTETTLRQERDERIAACRADLAAGGDVDLTAPEAGRRWIQVLNDLRLTLGTRLGVTEDDDHDIDPHDPDAQLRAVYYWLTAVQDAVVVELMH
jgi:hypothetical protein